MAAAVAVSAKYERLIDLIELACLLSAPVWVYKIFFAIEEGEPWTRFLLIPLIIGVNAALIPRASRGDAFLRRVMPVALIFKLAALAAYLYVVIDFYSLAADVSRYYTASASRAQEFILGGHWEWLYPFWSNNFVITITAGIFILLGTSLLMGCLVFAMISFWGEYLFYLAVREAFPEASRELAGTVFFFLPSIAFWTAAIGKDALIFAGIGLASYGFARVTRSLTLRSFVTLGAGIGLVTLVRPHVGAMLGMAIIVPFLIGKNLKGAMSMAGKLFSAPLLLGGTYYLVTRAQNFLSVENVSQSGSVLNRISHGSAIGGSAMSGGTSLFGVLINAPFLLFRPFLWEVRSTQSAIAAFEALVILIIVIRQRRAFREKLREWRSNSVVLFILLFTVEFSLVFAAAIRNFGLLTRQRVMLLPLTLTLFCVPAKSVAQLKRRRWTRVTSPVLPQELFLPRPAGNGSLPGGVS